MIRRLVPVLLLCAAACSSGGAARRPCTDEGQCETGQICSDARVCEPVSCSSRLDCPGASTCLATGQCGPEECSTNTDCADGKVCRDRACFPGSTLPDCQSGQCQNGKVCNTQTNKCEDCSATLRCPTGQTCRNGTCEATQTACNNDTACLPSGRVCDTQRGVCVACSDTRPCPSSHLCESGQCKPRPLCQNGQCTAPLVCDTATGYCVQNATVPLCGACTVDAECQGTGSKCLAFAGGKYCGKACSQSQPCPTGYVCAPTYNQCAPIAGRCRDNCIVTGCTGGLSCDDQTGLCMGPKRLCDTCSNDEECGGPTDNCIAGLADGGARYCSQDCDTSHVGGRACSTGFTCREISPTVKQCVPNGSECVTDPCAGVNCSPTSSTPICDPATRTCVECLEDRHCPASDQVCQNKVCRTPGACTGDASCAGDPAGTHCCQTTLGMRCAQCCNNTHCGGATPYCVANVCRSQQDPCAGVTCNPPQTCNPATGNCEGGGSVTCTSDSQCASGLKCDLQFNFCYDPSGLCADDTQCAPGQTCAFFCSGCAASGGYCPPGLFCLPLDANGICFGLPGFP